MVRKQTARKSTGGSFSPYSLAGDRIEDEDVDLAESKFDEDEEEADDDSMASETERVQDLRQKLDHARENLDVELVKGPARDRELVSSYERRVEDFRSELDSILKARTDTNLQQESQASISCAGQEIVQAIRDHGDSVSNVINETLVAEVREQVSAILEFVRENY